MKKIILLIGALILVLVTASYAKEKPQKDFTLLSVKKHTLYFKVSKSFLGGVVEVYDAKEKFMEAEDLPHTHTMVYFEEMPKGVYIIRVKKGDQCTEFKFDNN
jgi:hypothetical protein